MKFCAAVAIGSAVLAGTAMGFSRRAASPGLAAIPRRGSALAMAAPTEFAKAEIASNDVRELIARPQGVLISAFFVPFSRSCVFFVSS